MRHDRKNTRVYSSDHGRLCAGCGEPVTGCRCGHREQAPGGDGIVRIGRETKGRKGAGVTVVTGVPLAAADLKTLAGELKRLCGSGGTVKNGVIEIQGDHRDRLLPVLQSRGWTVKTSGG